MILTTIAIGFSLFYLKTVLLPFVIALFITIGCRPIIDFFAVRLKLGQYVAFGIAFAIGAALVVLFSVFTWVSINDLRRHSGKYEENLEKVAATIMKWFASKKFRPEVEPDVTDSESVTPATPNGLDNESKSPENDGVDVQLDSETALHELLSWATFSLQAQIPRIAGALSTILSNGVLVLIFVFFLMLGQESRDLNQPRIFHEMEDQVRGYLVMKTIISALTGIAFGFTLWLFGIPLAMLFGFLAFLMNYIPNIGPIISSLTPLPLIVLEPMSFVAKIICFALISAIQFVSGNVIETRIMGKSFDVSPVVLLLALMFFGLVWGIVGMFLATPIVSILKIVLQQYQPTKPIAEILAGRWTTSNTAEA